MDIDDSFIIIFQQYRSMIRIYPANTIKSIFFSFNLCKIASSYSFFESNSLGEKQSAGTLNAVARFKTYASG